LAPARADFAAGTRAYDAGDYATAYREWLPLAESGDPAAQRNLGHLFKFGQGVPRDLSQAFTWYKRAAEQDLDRAQVNVATMYLNGEGVEKDYKEARIWFEKAALMGNPLAQYNLGLMHERGLGVSKSEPRAIAWYYLAAKAGHVAALDRLAGLIAIEPLEKELGRKARLAAPPGGETGGQSRPPAASDAGPSAIAPQSTRSESTDGPETRPAGAAPWSPAAGQAPSSVLPFVGGGATEPQPLSGQTPARTAAAPAGAVPTAQAPAFAEAMTAYRGGDYQGALARWLPLARQGDQEAQYYIGLLYREGQGVPPDRIRAYAWWTVASKAGHAGAQGALGALAPWMTKGQLSDAEQLAATLVQR